MMSSLDFGGSFRAAQALGVTSAIRMGRSKYSCSTSGLPFGLSL